jgi:hypothetical protein
MINNGLFLAVIAAMKEAHPYETPAYYSFQVLEG